MSKIEFNSICEEFLLEVRNFELGRLRIGELLKHFQEFANKYVAFSENPDHKKEKKFLRNVLKCLVCIIEFAKEESPGVSTEVRGLINMLGGSLEQFRMKNSFVKVLTKNIFEILCDPELEVWIAKEILRLYVKMIRDSDKAVRDSVAKSTRVYYLGRLMDMVFFADYDYQSLIVETLFRMFEYNTRKDMEGIVRFEKEEQTEAFFKINLNSFDISSRSFLNILNQSGENVLSVLCHSVSFDQFQLREPIELREFEGMWFDFNIQIQSITFFIDNVPFMDASKNIVGSWEMLTIIPEIISSVDISYSNDKGKYKKTAIGKIILKSSVICSEKSHPLKDCRTLVLCSSDIEKFQRIFNKVIPTMCGTNGTREITNNSKKDSRQFGNTSSINSSLSTSLSNLSIDKSLRGMKRKCMSDSFSEITFSSSLIEAMNSSIPSISKKRKIDKDEYIPTSLDGKGAMKKTFPIQKNEHASNKERIPAETRAYNLKKRSHFGKAIESVIQSRVSIKHIVSNQLQSKGVQSACEKSNISEISEGNGCVFVEIKQIETTKEPSDVNVPISENAGSEKNSPTISIEGSLDDMSLNSANLEGIETFPHYEKRTTRKEDSVNTSSSHSLLKNIDIDSEKIPSSLSKEGKEMNRSKEQTVNPSFDFRKLLESCLGIQVREQASDPFDELLKEEPTRLESSRKEGKIPVMEGPNLAETSPETFESAVEDVATAAGDRVLLSPSTRTKPNSNKPELLDNPSQQIISKETSSGSALFETASSNAVDDVIFSNVEQISLLNIPEETVITAKLDECIGLESLVKSDESRADLRRAKKILSQSETIKIQNVDRALNTAHPEILEISDDSLDEVYCLDSKEHSTIEIDVVGTEKPTEQHDYEDVEKERLDMFKNERTSPNKCLDKKQGENSLENSAVGEERNNNNDINLVLSTPDENQKLLAVLDSQEDAPLRRTTRQTANLGRKHKTAIAVEDIHQQEKEFVIPPQEDVPLERMTKKMATLERNTDAETIRQQEKQLLLTSQENVAFERTRQTASLEQNFNAATVPVEDILQQKKELLLDTQKDVPLRSTTRQMATLEPNSNAANIPVGDMLQQEKELPVDSQKDVPSKRTTRETDTLEPNSNAANMPIQDILQQEKELLLDTQKDEPSRRTTRQTPTLEQNSNVANIPFEDILQQKKELPLEDVPSRRTTRQTDTLEPNSNAANMPVEDILQQEKELLLDIQKDEPSRRTIKQRATLEPNSSAANIPVEDILQQEKSLPLDSLEDVPSRRSTRQTATLEPNSNAANMTLEDILQQEKELLLDSQEDVPSRRTTRQTAAMKRKAANILADKPGVVVTASRQFLGKEMSSGTAVFETSTRNSVDDVNFSNFEQLPFSDIPEKTTVLVESIEYINPESRAKSDECISSESCADLWRRAKNILSKSQTIKVQNVNEGLNNEKYRRTKTPAQSQNLCSTHPEILDDSLDEVYCPDRTIEIDVVGVEKPTEQYYYEDLEKEMLNMFGNESASLPKKLLDKKQSANNSENKKSVVAEKRNDEDNVVLSTPDEDYENQKLLAVLDSQEEMPLKRTTRKTATLERKLKTAITAVENIYQQEKEFVIPLEKTARQTTALERNTDAEKIQQQETQLLLTSQENVALERTARQTSTLEPNFKAANISVEDILQQKKELRLDSQDDVPSRRTTRQKTALKRNAESILAEKIHQQQTRLLDKSPSEKDENNRKRVVLTPKKKKAILKNLDSNEATATIACETHKIREQRLEADLLAMQPTDKYHKMENPKANSSKSEAGLSQKHNKTFTRNLSRNNSNSSKRRLYDPKSPSAVSLATIEENSSDSEAELSHKHNKTFTRNLSRNDSNSSKRRLCDSKSPSAVSLATIEENSSESEAELSQKHNKTVTRNLSRNDSNSSKRRLYDPKSPLAVSLEGIEKNSVGTSSEESDETDEETLRAWEKEHLVKQCDIFLAKMAKRTSIYEPSERRPIKKKPTTASEGGVLLDFSKYNLINKGKKKLFALKAPVHPESDENHAVYKQLVKAYQKFNKKFQAGKVEIADETTKKKLIEEANFLIDLI